MLFAFCEDKIIALGASKKAKLLQDLSGVCVCMCVFVCACACVLKYPRGASKKAKLVQELSGMYIGVLI